MRYVLFDAPEALSAGAGPEKLLLKKGSLVSPKNF